jgi:hypothetical protein
VLSWFLPADALQVDFLTSPDKANPLRQLRSHSPLYILPLKFFPSIRDIHTKCIHTK